MPGGKSARRKGDVGERELVDLLRSMGKSARRVPLSGACATFKGDIWVGDPCNACRGDGKLHDWVPDGVPVEQGTCGHCNGTGAEPGTEEIYEVKRRAGAFKLIYRWLEDCHVIAFRGDRQEWIVCLRLKDLKGP